MKYNINNKITKRESEKDIVPMISRTAKPALGKVPYLTDVLQGGKSE
jgi:hypothetical protein